MQLQVMFTAQKVFLSSNEVRKVTRKNIASLYAALVHLMDVSKVVYSQRVMSYSGILYNRILSIFDISAIDTISELKLARRWFLEYIRQGDISNPGIEAHRWDDTNNCPFLLTGVDELISHIEGLENTDPNFAYQILFSMLSIDRVIVVPVRSNHSTITDGPTLDSTLIPTAQEVKAALAALGITSLDFKNTYQDMVHNFDWEILSTKGPNGDATWTAHLDARAWSYNANLLLHLRSFLEESGLTSILRHLLGCIKSGAHEVIPNLNPLLGKLAYIEEWGGKRRIVAQLDYWTQMAMTPLHNTINFFLRNMVQDGTFNQHKVADRVKAWSKADSGVELFCYDLSAATDRLPISFQETILTTLFNSTSFASSWAAILTDREFLTENGDFITYNTGQPMGARSSFPMLALTHHIIMQIAAARAGITNYVDYCVLGDDGALTNSLVATQYKAIMGALGVPINLTKSIEHVPDSTPLGEICKRVFMDGVEISRFNPKLIVNTINDARLAPDLQNDLFLRGWSFSDDIFWSFVAGLLDAENLTNLIKLNIAPIAVTGLLHQYTPDTELVDFSKWIPEFPNLNSTMLVELFTYITASEALKRLDALLRATVTINDSLSILAAAHANPKAIPQFVRDDWLRQDLSEEELKLLSDIISNAGPITPSHPVVLASRSEANRISELLHSLNSLDTTMVERARVGLLDVFRTSVSSIWLGNSQVRESENRALFHKLLSTLNKLFTDPKRVVKNERNLSLSYSVVLTTLARLWSVSITFGGQCRVNALRSSITRHTNAASTTLSTVLGDLSILAPTTTSQAPRPPASKRAVKRQRVVLSRISKKSPPGAE